MDKQHLSPQQQAVLDCIPAGHKEAVSRRRLAEKSRLNERKVRKIIFTLIVKHGIPIGSCTGKDGLLAKSLIRYLDRKITTCQEWLEWSDKPSVRLLEKIVLTASALYMAAHVVLWICRGG